MLQPQFECPILSEVSLSRVRAPARDYFSVNSVYFPRRFIDGRRGYQHAYRTKRASSPFY
jgi:hypothetical protein